MLLPFVLFAVLIIVVLLSLLYALYPGSRKVSTIPGLDPTTESDGNTPDIAKAGSMTEFLIGLHKEFGSIASFWIGREFIVSIASPELLKEISHLFDRPDSLYNTFEPLIGAQSVQFKNGPEGQQLRRMHDRSFTQAKLSNQFPMIQQICADLCTKWAGMSGADQHIPLSQHMHAMVTKTLSRFAFGDYFKDEKALIAFRKDYDHCFWLMENVLVEGPLQPGSEKEKQFKEGISRIKQIVKKIIAQRQEAEVAPEDKVFIDSLLDEYDNEDMVFDDVITYLVGGSHTTAFLLTWAFYFLATHQDIQEKLFKEVDQHYKGGDLTPASLKDMKYLHNFINESLRVSKIAPFAARCSTHDSILGGHKVPKDTPIITSIGTIMEDEKLWENPKVFNPDRFDGKKKIPAYAFEPFGFAGKRKCPGYRLSEFESEILIVLALKQFKVSMVPGQVVEIKYGLVTKPADEIWITIEKRK